MSRTDNRPTPTELILALAASFPCLVDKIAHYHPKEFEADEFHKLIGPWSSGEKLCALFILNVWNPGYAKSKGWKFDLFDFAAGCDFENKEALIRWLEHPLWP